MFNFITKYFTTTTVSGILAIFTELIAKLEAHAEAKSLEVVAHVESQDKFQKLAQLAAKEQAAARQAIAKIQALF